MDELAKRREARRRKILENSQNRLSRITGIEQKPIQSSECNNHVRAEVQQHDNTNYLEPRTVYEAQPEQDTITVKENRPKQTRTIVICALAVFINVLVFCLDNFVNSILTSMQVNIFLPLLVYVATEFMTSKRQQTENKSLAYLLLMANARNYNMLGVLKYAEIVANFMQDVMIYFFTYGCCDFIKHLMWVSS